MSLRRMMVLALFLSGATLAPGQALAHALSRSFSTWHIGEAGDVRMHFSAGVRDVLALRGNDSAALLPEILADHLKPRLSLRLDGQACVVQAPSPAPPQREANATAVRIEWVWRCPTPAPQSRIALHNDAFFDQLNGHLHFARMIYRGGGPGEALLTAQTRAFESQLDEKAAPPTSGGSLVAIILRYLSIGIEHIAIGFDHLAFLAALMLVCRTPRTILIAVTGFTLGHSATLGLAAFQLLSANIPVVEALIGFTILLVAAESLGLRDLAPALAAILAGLGLLSWWAGGLIGPSAWIGLILFTACYAALCPTPDVGARASPILAMLFGLIHGLGFAALLDETGLPRGQALPALAGFNLGIEVGQILFVLLFLALGWGVDRLCASTPFLSRARLVLPALTAALLAGLGAYWFGSRAFA